MKDCSRASKCQYGCCNEPYKCELNDDKPYCKEIEEMEMTEIAVGYILCRRYRRL